MRRARAVAALSALVLLAGLRDQPIRRIRPGRHGPEADGGHAGRAALGGFVGSQIGGGSGQLAAVAVGTLAGAFLGSQLGRSLDQRDREYASRAQYNAVQYGTPYNWRNPQVGQLRHCAARARLMARHTANSAANTRTRFTSADGASSAYGTACLQPDGSWRITSS